MHSRTVWWALAADLVCVVAFAAGGKSAHDESSTWWVIARIAWPFALACLVGVLVTLQAYVYPFTALVR